MTKLDLLLLECQEMGLDISNLYTESLGELAVEEIRKMNLNFPTEFKGKFLRYAFLGWLNGWEGEIRPMNPLPFQLFNVEKSPLDYGMVQESRFSDDFYDSLSSSIVVEHMLYRYPDDSSIEKMRFLDNLGIPDRQICLDLQREGINVSRWVDQVANGEDQFEMLQAFGEHKFVQGPTIVPKLSYSPEKTISEYRRELQLQLQGKPLWQWIVDKNQE